jgi:chemotaxis protein MotB
MLKKIMRTGTAAAVLAAALIAGCGPDAKDQKIAELSGELDRVKDELNDRERQLNGLALRDEDSQRAVRDLSRERADLRAKLAAAPTEIPEGQWVGMPGFDMISISGEVLFDSGKATLKPGGRATLDKIASDIRARFADRDIYVVGHTDDEPIRKSGWRDNWQLGAERALASVRYLIGAGIPPTKIVQANCGEFRPRTPNTSAASRLQNRRVEFYAVIKRPAATEAGHDLSSSTGLERFESP